MPCSKRRWPNPYRWPDMERRTYFADVILPLAIPRQLTYRIPHGVHEQILPGMRVVVQLGKTKRYTAIVRAVHENPPEYQAKYVEAVLDHKPIVTEGQLRLWEWMADYYVCTTGEVMSAALPGSFRLASETKVVLDSRWDGDDTGLNDKEFLIVEGLQIQGALSIGDITDLLDQKTVLQHVKSLVEKGVVISEEELKERYTPKKETWVTLHPSVHTEDELQAAFDQLEKRSPRQMEVLMAFFHLTGNADMADRAVTRKALQRHAGTDTSVTRKLADKNILVLEERIVDRMAEAAQRAAGSPTLSAAQNTAYQETLTGWEEKPAVLLHGVTGSGKTEVYITLMQEAIARGEQVLFLVPEIALTTQLTARLKKVFGERIGVYHSKFNPNERVEIWNHVLDWTPGRYDVVVGARSSVFLPFKKLGLIIVDEEHESSYKQYNPTPRYQARDVALVLAKLFKAKVLLGSATPSLESYNNALEGRYALVEMHERYGGITLPEVFCGDIKQELKQKSMKGIFTQFLLDHMQEVLSKGEQIILFQNRRGYTPLWQCQVCGEVPQCKRCDVSLTYHKHAHQLRCHYCGYQEAPPSTCGHCGNHHLKMLGFGTEKIEEEVQQFFPDARVQRLDLETTRSKNAYQRIIQSFADREVDVLVGTQMVTKGLDFDNVALVGVLNADQMLKFPDFRSFERSYQLMTQVAGRAGRREKRGKVVIQTYSPDHWVLRRVMEHDYLGMYRDELPERRNFMYPPFFRLIEITLRHKDARLAEAGAHRFATELRGALGDRVLGPEQPYISRINNYFLRKVLVKVEKAASPAHVKQLIHQAQVRLQSHPDYKSMRVAIDVDPA